MSFRNGKYGSLKINNVEARLEEWDLDDSAPEHEITNFDSPTDADFEEIKRAEFDMGVAKSVVNVRGKVSKQSGTVPYLAPVYIRAGKKDLQVFLGFTPTVGFNVTCHVKNVKYGGRVGDMFTFSAQLVVTGPVTHPQA